MQPNRITQQLLSPVTTNFERWLNAESGVDINMNEATGSFGFVINGGSSFYTVRKLS